MRCFVLALCALSLGCMPTFKMTQKVPPSAACPPANTELPYLQIKTNAQAFVGCRVGTQVAFLGAGNPGNMRPMFEEDDVWRAGEVLFAVAAPNESETASQMSAGGIQGGVLVSAANAQALYAART